MRTRAKGWMAAALLALGVPWGQAAVTLWGQFGQGMVVQRGQPVRLSGTAPALSRVALALGGASTAIQSDGNGSWSGELSPLPAGGPYTLTVTGEAGESLTVSDILSGDVWLWAGDQGPRSPARAVDMLPAGAIGADIRVYGSQPTSGGGLKGPQREAAGTGWQVAGTERQPQATVEMVQFALAMRQLTGVPVGLIVCTAAKTPIESWISAEGFRQGRRRQELDDLAGGQRGDPALGRRLWARLESWEAEVLAPCREKNGLETSMAGGDLDDSRWSPCQVPEASGAGRPAVTWYRRRIVVPAGWNGHRLRLRLGRIGASHQVYFNGELIGAVHERGQELDDSVSSCTIPPERVRAGQENLLAVRLIDFTGEGCLAGPGAALFISPEGEEHVRLSLSGTWRQQQVCQLAVKSASARPRTDADPAAPIFLTALFNTMIAPWTVVAVRGIIWEHGTRQAGQHREYLGLLPLLIRDWRRAWAQEKLPFVIVQLGAAAAALPADPWQDEEPADHAWASLREVQAAVAAGMPATGLCLGLQGDGQRREFGVSPMPLGLRLAAEAGRLCGLKTGTTAGPLFHRQEIQGETVRLAFRQTGSGLCTSDEAAPAGFSVAGRDGRFFPAEAVLEGDIVVVRSDRVPLPVSARYGWSGNPSRCNFYNRDGYPAVPFRSQPPDYLKLP